VISLATVCGALCRDSKFVPRETEYTWVIR
jgi:hypothetical protein